MTTQQTKWGPEIPVNGKRPEWLEHGASIQWGNADGEPDWSIGSDCVTAEPADAQWFWHDIEYIRLPVDHPHYAEVPANPQAPTPSPELTARMVAFVREVAASPQHLEGPWAREARAIAAELEPVDPVEAAADEVVGKLLKRGYLFANPQQALEVARFGVEAGRALAEAGK